MNYPEPIYRDLEIIESDICGETHYALQETKSFLGINYKKLVKISTILAQESKWFSQRWHSSKAYVEKAKKSIDKDCEYHFRKAMTE